MFWSRSTCRIGLVLCAGVAGSIALPAAAQQAVAPRVTATIGGDRVPEPAVGRIVLHAPWALDGVLTVPSPVGEASLGGPRLHAVVLPITPASSDRRDDAGSAVAEGSHTIVFSTLGLILVVAIITILLVK